MARILAVFEFTVELREVRKALGDDFEILHAHDLAEARQWARAGSIDLIIASTGLKDSDPGYLWVVLGKLVGQGAPFIFIKDPAVERSLPSVTVLSRPLSPKALRDAVEFALKNRKREEGGFQDAGLDKILARIEEDQLSGVLTAYYDKLIKRVVCTGGRVSFCGSNDPSELVGQAFVRSGLISEKDLMEAIAVQEKTAEPLGKVLQALRKVTQDQVKRTIADKFREAVLDLYLWTDGSWVFQLEGGFARPPAEEFQLDVQELRAEGQRRAARWAELAQRLPSPMLRFRVHSARAVLGPEPTWVERRVMSLARSGSSLGDMVMEVRGQEYPVYDFVAKMLDCGAFQIASDEPDVDEPLMRALEPDSDGPEAAASLISTRTSDAPAPTSRRPVAAPPQRRPSSLPSLEPSPPQQPSPPRAPATARPQGRVRARPDPRRESLAGLAAVREVPSLDAPARPRPDPPTKPPQRDQAPRSDPRMESDSPSRGLSREQVGDALRLMGQGERMADAVQITVRERSQPPNDASPPLDAPRTTIREGGKGERSVQTRHTIPQGRRAGATGERATVREGAGRQDDRAELDAGVAEPVEAAPAADASGPPSEPFGVVRSSSEPPRGLASMLEPASNADRSELEVESAGFDLSSLIQEELARPRRDDEAPDPEGVERASSRSPKGNSASLDPTSTSLLAEAREAKMAGELDMAMQTLRYVLIIEPLNPHARREVEEVEDLQRRGVEKLGVTPEHRVQLVIELSKLASIALSPEEAFILTRLAAEPMRVRDLMAICPMGEHETLKLVAEHITAGHVGIVD